MLFHTKLLLTFFLQGDEEPTRTMVAGVPDIKETVILGFRIPYDSVTRITERFQNSL